ncbi:hypothetical protein AB1Y20_008332 [Prymnesium parvum]|uniref:Phosphoinositide phospholipase C n=1 Tax=Prymnesium parvum TaxID=97485 RepID=A0AB34ITF3_PRYPA
MPPPPRLAALLLFATPPALLRLAALLLLATPAASLRVDAPGQWELHCSDGYLRLALANATSPLLVTLPEGATLLLGGAPLLVTAVNATIRSSGAGATLDAAFLSPLLLLSRGASLTLEAITLAHAASPAASINASSLVMLRCALRDCGGGGPLVRLAGGELRLLHSSLHGATEGALAVEEGFALLRGCLISNCSSATTGGALQLSGGHVVISGCAIRTTSAQESHTATTPLPFALSDGGAVFMSAGNLSVADGTLISDCRAETGGALLIEGGVLTMSHSFISDATATRDGGAIVLTTAIARLENSTIARCRAFLTCGGVQVTRGGWFEMGAGSTIIHAECETNAGALYLDVGTLSVRDSSILHSTAGLNGGVIQLFAGACFIDGCIVEDSVADGGSGGVVYLIGGVILITSCTISHSYAFTDGGMALISNGQLTVMDATISFSASGRVRCSAFMLSGTLPFSLFFSCLPLPPASLAPPDPSSLSVLLALFALSTSLLPALLFSQFGGAVTGSGGHFRLEASALYHSHALSASGAVGCSGLIATISRGCLISNATAESGGAMGMASGGLTISGGCVVRDAHAEVGGAVALQGGTVAMSDCVIVGCTSWLGAIHVSAGVMTVSNSLLTNNSATECGGALYIESGLLSVDNSSISHATSESFGGAGAACALFVGVLRIVNVVANITQSATGSFLYVSSHPTPTSAVVLTFVEVHHQQCGGAIVSLSEALQLVSRVFSVSNSECLEDPPPPQIVGVAPIGCGGAYQVAGASPTGVCASSSADACHADTPLSLSCTCPWPEYANPELDEQLAAYSPSGCITPMRLIDITVISQRVVVALTKPSSAVASLNATLRIEGSDVSRLVEWEALNASLLSPWLHLPAHRGEVDPRAIRAGATEVPVALVLSARGLQERAAPYRETVHFLVSSAVRVVRSLEVLLTVEAQTHAVTWHAADAPLTAAEEAALSFTARDADGLPVNHQLPRQSDPRRFSATLTTAAGATLSPDIAYVGSGVYAVRFTVTTWGGVLLSLRLNGTHIPPVARNATCAAGRVALPTGRCGCPAGYFQPTEAEPCLPCSPARTSSAVGAVGSVSCDVCAAGFYLPSPSLPAASGCTPCPAGSRCAANSTLRTIVLHDGYWRLSPLSTKVLRCDAPPEGPACVGGGHVGACAAGYAGPRCVACNSSSQYASGGVCVDCPEWGKVLAAAGGAGLGAALAALAAWGAARCAPSRLPRLALLVRKAGGTLVAGVGWRCKLRILVSFFQCFSVVDTLYLVKLPTDVLRLLDAFEWFSIDWTDLFVAPTCIGSFEVRLVLTAAAPLVLMLLIVAAFLARAACRRGRDGLLHAVHESTAPCLLIIFLLAPSVCRNIFTAWDCEPFEYSATERRFFLRSSPTTQCYTAAHDRVLLLSYVLIALWPVGSVVLFAALVVRARHRLLKRKVDTYVHSIRFLHADFRPELYLWASIELALRCVLTGWLLLIDGERSFLRLIIALLLALTMLVLTLALRPYRRLEDNMLGCAAMLLLVLTYTCCTYIKVFEDVNDAAAPLGDAQLAARVLGFASAGVIVWLLATLGFVLLGFMCLLVVHQLRNEQQLDFLRLKENGQLPKVTLSKEHNWMLFLSHV